jgi:hypothetical protein
MDDEMAEYVESPETLKRFAPEVRGLVKHAEKAWHTKELGHHLQFVDSKAR